MRELLRYNERTNVYSKSAYEHLPFHVQDSVVLAQHLQLICLNQGADSAVIPAYFHPLSYSLS